LELRQGDWVATAEGESSDFVGKLGSIRRFVKLDELAL
jgi:hypothetical protein